MMLVVILNLIVVLTALFLIIGITWRFLKENRVHRRRMRKLDQWSGFHQDLMNWSREISDVGVRVNFINNCVHELVHYGTDKLRSNKLDDWDIDLEKKKICDEWGKYIPSLVQEIREKKLNQIL